MRQMNSALRPPLAKPSIGVRTRRVLRSESSALHTPLAPSSKSVQRSSRTRESAELELRPEYNMISSELRALEKKVHDEIGEGAKHKNHNCADNVLNSLNVNSSPLFERGRFYEEYSARRNEKLKRKKIETGEEFERTPYNLGVNVELSTKRRGGESKRVESLRKSVSAAYSSVEKSNEKPRYMLRSRSKENSKPPLATSSVSGVGSGVSLIPSVRKIGTRSVRRS